MAISKNKYLKRAVIIIIVVFSLFSSYAVYFVFRSSMNMDAKHIRVIKLSGNVESEILKTRILIDDLILENKAGSITEIQYSLNLIKNGLNDLNTEFTEEFKKINNNDLEDFTRGYKKIHSRFLEIETYVNKINPDHIHSLKSELFNHISNFSLSYREFDFFLQRYLLDNTNRYKKAIVWVMILLFIFVVLAVLLIIRLLNELIIADKKLLFKTLEVEIRERERIAKDLHDGLGSVLSGMVMHFQVLEKATENNPELCKKIEYLNHLSKHSLESMEEIINNLNPSLLARFGLAKTLEKNILKLNSLGKTQFHLDTEKFNAKLTPGTDVLIYRICSELMNNALKHSRAEKANFQLLSTKKEIQLIYNDNGIGFDYNIDFYEKNKTGLHNIQGRVESIGGKCIINSQPDKGMYVKISLPLSKV